MSGEMYISERKYPLLVNYPFKTVMAYRHGVCNHSLTHTYTACPSQTTEEVFWTVSREVVQILTRENLRVAHH